MGAQASLTLATRVYTPIGVSNGLGTWRYVDDTIFNGTSLVTQAVRGPSKDGVYRIQHKLDTPRVKADDSACGCAGEEIDRAVTRVETIFPASWSKTMRQEHFDRIQSLIAGTVVTSAYDDLENVW